MSFTTATLGGEIAAPTLEGEVNLKVPEGTQSGKVFRLRGKGVKPVRNAGKGDLYCRVEMETPVNLTEKQGKHDVLAKVWARKKIESLMQSTSYQGSPAIEEEVTAPTLRKNVLKRLDSLTTALRKEQQPVAQARTYAQDRNPDS